MPVAGGIVLLVVGAILSFALSTGTVHGLDLHVVGVIFMLAGVAGLLLPRLIRGGQDPDQPATHSRQDAIDDGTLAELPADDLALKDQRKAQDRRRLWARRDPSVPPLDRDRIEVPSGAPTHPGLGKRRLSAP